MEKKTTDYVEIDLLQLLKTLWQKKFFIVMVGLLSAIITFLYTSFLVTPEYDSTTRIYVVNQSTVESGLTNSDLQAGSFLVRDYKEIILSQDTLNRTEEKLGLELNSKKISVDIPVDTRIISITVRNSDSTEAARIANTLREEAAQKIIEVTKVNDVTILEEAVPAEKASTPNTIRNTMLGLLAGTGLIVMVIVALEVVDDRVKRPEDIEEVMGLPLLGVVPDVTKLK